MNEVPRKICLCVSLLLAGVAGIAFFAAPASAAGKKCNRLPLSVKLSSHDPTDLLEKAQAWVYVKPKARVRGARVKVRRGGKVFAKGRISGRLAAGRTSIVRLRVIRDIKGGKYRVDVKARKAGCRNARTKKSRWGFRQ
ncbi:MAG: hypothetical protein M3Y23_06465, partial [Actinomycetota bacterium]|nr:hypothetical protein [Actinomycetota bacterium]